MKGTPALSISRQVDAPHHEAPTHRPPQPAPRGVRVLSLFVFIDALGWQILNRHSFLRDILTVQAPLETVFGYSSTCDPTILTGRLPHDHGHFAFYYYSPSTSPFRALKPLSLLPKRLTSRGRVRHLASRVVAKVLGYTGYFQLYNMPFEHLGLFDYSEKRDIYQPGGINAGVPTILDELRAHHVPFHLSDWRKSEQHNLAAAEAALASGDPRFAYIYLAGLDGLMHEHGTRSPLVAEKLAWYEQQLRRLVATADAAYDEVRLHVFSDHGMTDVEACVDLATAVESTGARFGQDYVAVYDSTMARFWFLSEAGRDAVMSVLSDTPQGSILSSQTLSSFGCDFMDSKYGELFFLLRPGMLLCPSHMGAAPVAAMHGYTPRHAGSTAAYASNVHGIVPRHLTDLHGLMHRETFLVGA